jgi:hypothetical protein
MKVSKISERIQAFDIAHLRLLKDREIELRHANDRKVAKRLQETRTERAQRLDLNKGRNVDVDC